MASFAQLATATFNTLRSPVIAGGKRGDKATKLTGIKGLPVMPVDPDLAERLNLGTHFEIAETYVDGTLDILEGDGLLDTAANKLYDIRAVADWPWKTDLFFKRLILEEVKGR